MNGSKKNLFLLIASMCFVALIVLGIFFIAERAESTIPCGDLHLLL